MRIFDLKRASKCVSPVSIARPSYPDDSKNSYEKPVETSGFPSFCLPGRTIRDSTSGDAWGQELPIGNYASEDFSPLLSLP